MSNNKNSPKDDSNVESRKLYRSCKHSDKLRRFTYTNWCPICESESSRRRSKSETIETVDNNSYRKRLRDSLKSPSPKKHDVPTSENNAYGDARSFLEASRMIRANLCELPTTYINNCQPQVPSVNTDSSYKKYNVEPMYGSVENYQNGKYRNDVGKMNGITRLHYLTPHPQPEKNRSNSLDNKYSDAIFHEAYKNLSPTKNFFNRIQSPYGDETPRLEEFPSKPLNPPNKSPVKHDQPVPREALKRLLPTPRPKIPERPKLPVRPKTCTPEQLRSDNYMKFKNEIFIPKDVIKHKSDSIVANEKHSKSCYVTECHANKKILESPLEKVPEKSTKSYRKSSAKTPEKQRVNKTPEKVAPKPHVIIPSDMKTPENHPPSPRTPERVLIKILEAEGKRKKVRPRSDSDTSIGSPDPNNKEDTATKKAREVSPLQPKKEFKAKSAVKLASIKNRHKISVTKLRKVRNKIAHSVSSDSNLSGSDFEDAENEGDLEFYEESNVESGSTPTHKVTTDNDPTNEFGIWPVRASLFPHVPPYIKFASHDNDSGKLPSSSNKHFKWRLSNITPIVVRKTLSNTGFRLVRSEYSRDSNDWTGTWGKHIKSVVFQTLKETQKLNHFPGTFQIGRKDRLWKNLQRLMFKFGIKEFGFIPRTYVLPHDLKLLRQAWEKTGMDKWIIKPPASARGTGIRVIHRWAHLPKKKSLVVQQYISNPYLINGSKFDLRLYVLVTSFNPLRVYLYPEGLARFASTKYSDDLSTLSDRYMHLTNYSINKLSSHYSANEDANACKGHKWTLSKLWEYLEKEGVNTKNLWRSLQQLVIKTMLCGESSITQLFKAHVNSRYNCYELFGVDVLLDERLKPWLLEVNISPSLHSASPLDLHVKGPLVQSLLNLAQFHLSPKLMRVANAPPCLDKNLYTIQLTTQERLKHIHYVEFEKREEYLTGILKELTGDDVRHLIQAEDELTVIGSFERIFPTQHTFTYFQFMEPRYYNRLFDAWEARYEKNRSAGIKLLQGLCERKLHLDVPPSATKKSFEERNSPTSTTPEVTTSSEDISRPPTPKRPQTSPAPVTVDPTIKALRNEIRYKLMSLSLGMGAVSPI